MAPLDIPTCPSTLVVARLRLGLARPTSRLRTLTMTRVAGSVDDVVMTLFSFRWTLRYSGDQNGRQSLATTLLFAVRGALSLTRVTCYMDKDLLETETAWAGVAVSVGAYGIDCSYATA